MSAKLFNRYEVIERLGEGAQSTVYLVRDLLNHNVLKAAKVLKKEYWKENSSASLIQEFQILESVDHENLVRVHECQMLPGDGVPVLITEYQAHASNLETYLSQAESRPLNEKMQIAYPIVQALRYLHRKKIIHGDLKPSNILITLAHETLPIIKLIDFGVSHDLIVSQEKKRVGTPYYMAPEVVREGIELASDVYSLGVIFYRLFISSQLPYHGMERDQILYHHLSNTAFFLKEHFLSKNIPITLSTFIQQCLSVDPRERPRDLTSILQTLRFEFSAELDSFPPLANDTRLRQCLGLRGQLTIAEQLIQTHCLEDGPKTDQHIKHLLFASAPSGGGKTRFLNEIAKFCQRKHLSHLYIPYQTGDFWNRCLEDLMLMFSHAKETKRQFNQLKMISESTNLLTHGQLYVRYLLRLANELNGLVLLIDGLNRQLDTHFLQTLRLIARFLNQRQQGSEARCVMIFTIDNRPIQEDYAHWSHGNQELLLLAHDLSDSIARGESFQMRNEGSRAARKEWEQIPEQVRMLGKEGMAHLLVLPPWKNDEVAVYLEEVFPDSELSVKDIAMLQQKSQGNPGLLQALCNEILETKPLMLDSPNELFSLPGNLDMVHDLHVYKLKYYDEHAKTLLAFLAGVESATQEQMTVIWDSFCVQGKVIDPINTLIRAFDDGLIQKNKRGEFFLPNENLKLSLQARAGRDQEGIRASLLTILTSETAQHMLSLQQRFYLSRYLRHKRLWSEILLQILQTESSSAKRMAYAPYLNELRREIQSLPDWEGVDEKTRLQLDFLGIEMAILHLDIPQAKQLAEQLLLTLEGIESENDTLFFNLSARTWLYLGIVHFSQHALDESSCAFEHALQSNILPENERDFAEGFQLLCKICDASTSAPGTRSYLEKLTPLRSRLRQNDPVRHAILTANIGGYYLNKNEPLRALPYLTLANRIFSEHGELGRQITTLRRIGKIHYLTGQYQKAFDILHRALPLAENLGFDREGLDILVIMIRALFLLGDFRNFASTCTHFISICERLQDLRPLAHIIEPAVHAYLENGRIEQALQLVQKRLQTLEQSTLINTPSERLIAELLAVGIFQYLNDWTQAKSFHDQAGKSISSVSEHHAHAPAAKQMHILYHIAFLNQDSGPQAACSVLYEHIRKGDFQGSMLDEAYFQCFHFALCAGDHLITMEILPQCLQHFPKATAQQRLSFYIDMARLHLDQNDTVQAAKDLRSGALLLKMVPNHLLRAEFYDQNARYASDLAKPVDALQHWNRAEKELELNMKTWTDEQKRGFQEHSLIWQNHRIIYTLLRAKLN